MNKYVNILDGPCDYKPNEEIMTFPFEPDNFQKHAFKSIEEGNNMLVTVPTSSGKTVVAEYAIFNCLKKGKRALYASPIKTLSNEKYNDFKTKFEISIGLLTGDNKIDINSSCLIITAEILRNALFKLKNKIENANCEIDDNFIDTIGCLVLDEIQYMNDPERGTVWEEIIDIIDPKIQLIMLSATINNSIEICNWIGNIKQKNISLIPSTIRIIPLKHYIYVNDYLYEFLNNTNDYNTTKFKEAEKEYTRLNNIRMKKHRGIDYDILKRLVYYLKEHNLLQSIFFCLSKQNCEKYAKLINNCELTTIEEASEIEKVFNHYMHKYIKQFENAKQFYEIKGLLMKGICYHHSGVYAIMREMIEILFKKGFIKILFATETFSVGVNMPTRSVIFTELIKPTKKEKRLLTTAEFRQMAGRAGRRGLDTCGHVIILPLYEFPNEKDIKTVALGNIPKIESQFKWKYEFFLKIIQSEIVDIHDFFEKSLIQINHNNILSNYEKDNEFILLENINLENELSKVETKKIEMVNTYIKLDEKQNDTLFCNFKILLSKKEQKEYNNIKQNMNNNDNKKILELLIKKTNNNNLYQKNLKEIDEYKNFAYNNFNMIGNLLLKWNYVYFKDNSYIPTTKGIIASHINDCNPIILTEIIMDDYLDDLSCEEIIAFISIFTENIKSDHQKDRLFYDFEGTDKLHLKLKKLNTLINSLEIDEETILPYIDVKTNWVIYSSYIDVSLGWANKKNVVEIIDVLNLIGEYEGNFTRNMLKIYKICSDIKNLVSIIGKLSIVQKLENIEELILRDIVSIDSIYLSTI
jgi:superfamily II RNA helicase